MDWGDLIAWIITIILKMIAAIVLGSIFVVPIILIIRNQMRNIRYLKECEAEYLKRELRRQWMHIVRCRGWRVEVDQCQRWAIFHFTHGNICLRLRDNYTSTGFPSHLLVRTNSTGLFTSHTGDVDHALNQLEHIKRKEMRRAHSGCERQKQPRKRRSRKKRR